MNLVELDLGFHLSPKTLKSNVVSIAKILNYDDPLNFDFEKF